MFFYIYGENHSDTNLTVVYTSSQPFTVRGTLK